MSKSYLCIDPALSTGWAIFTLVEEVDALPHGHVLTLVKFGRFEIPHESVFEGDWLIETERLMSAVLDDLSFPIEYAYMEDYYFSKKFCNGTGVNYKIRGALEMCLRRHEIPYRLISPASWSSWLKGGGNVRRRRPTALESKKATEEAVRNKYLLAIPEKIGRRKMPSDIYDAIGIGLYALTSLYPGVSFKYHTIAAA